MMRSLAVSEIKGLGDLNTTEGTISVSKLDLSNQAPPVLEAAASFKVGLDSLELPLGANDTFRLKEERKERSRLLNSRGSKVINHRRSMQSYASRFVLMRS